VKNVLKNHNIDEVPLHSNDPKVDEAKEPKTIFQPFQISGDLSLFLSKQYLLLGLSLISDRYLPNGKVLFDQRSKPLS
jgi:hypothetical protein